LPGPGFRAELGNLRGGDHGRWMHRCPLGFDLEEIDIGGPSMVRAAAKNYAGVGVVVDPRDYAALLAELKTNHGRLSDATRFSLAQKAFSHTAAYDGAISNYLTARDASGAPRPFPDRFNWQGAKLQDLRYGENPHQQAAFYRDEMPAAGTIAMARQLQGKELSYNNIADSDAACLLESDDPRADGSSLDRKNVDQSVHDARIEMRARALAELGRGVLRRAGLPVRAVGRHRAPRVARADDARCERNVFACEPVRVPGAVPPLVA